ncbi:hypothetical protein BN1723_020432, partial [Verticillium longisporum]
HVSGGEVK